MVWRNSILIEYLTQKLNTGLVEFTLVDIECQSFTFDLSQDGMQLIFHHALPYFSQR